MWKKFLDTFLNLIEPIIGILGILFVFIAIGFMLIVLFFGP